MSHTAGRSDWVTISSPVGHAPASYYRSCPGRIVYCPIADHLSWMHAYIACIGILGTCVYMCAYECVSVWVHAHNIMWNFCLCIANLCKCICMYSIHLLLCKFVPTHQLYFSFILSRGAAVAVVTGMYALLLSLILYMLKRKPANKTWQGTCNLFLAICMYTELVFLLLKDSFQSWSTYIHRSVFYANGTML